MLDRLHTPKCLCSPCTSSSNGHARRYRAWAGDHRLDRGGVTFPAGSCRETALGKDALRPESDEQHEDDACDDQAQRRSEAGLVGDLGQITVASWSPITMTATPRTTPRVLPGHRQDRGVEDDRLHRDHRDGLKAVRYPAYSAPPNPPSPAPRTYALSLVT